MLAAVPLGPYAGEAGSRGRLGMGRGGRQKSVAWAADVESALTGS